MTHGAYWIAHVTVTDTEKYTGYQALAPKAFADHKAEFIVRGGAAETLEGPDFARHVVIGFPTLADARACYDSAEYRAAREARAGACTAHIVIVEALAPSTSIG